MAFAELSSHVSHSQCEARCEDFYSFVSHNSAFFLLFCDPLKRLSFSICFWMFNLQAVCVRISVLLVISLRFHKIFGLNTVIFFFFHLVGLNLVHVFRDCTYLPSISIGLDRLKVEETTRRTKCRLNEDFFLHSPALVSFFFFFFFFPHIAATELSTFVRWNRFTSLRLQISILFLAPTICLCYLFIVLLHPIDNE